MPKQRFDLWVISPDSGQSLRVLVRRKRKRCVRWIRKWRSIGRIEPCIMVSSCASVRVFYRPKP